jgi:hypothetical protein
LEVNREMDEQFEKLVSEASGGESA